jgi:predicted O-methyltransferase YrrM
MKEDKSNGERNGISTQFKKAKMKDIGENERFYCNIKLFSFRIISICSIIILIIIIIAQLFIIHKLNKNRLNSTQQNKSYISDNKENIILKQKYDVNFIYEEYDREVITDRMKKDAKWIVGEEEAYFINGIIRKNKLKNCLEIGVAQGGSSILILNAIKDLENSVLVSLDLNNEVFTIPDKKTGYRVNQYFPELSKKWKLFTGEQPHKFLVDLNIKFDFLFLDSAHVSPGEILNFIEALPFLNDNAVIVIHDLLWHYRQETKIKFFPSNIRLMPALLGDKIFMNHKVGGAISNIGAAFLYPNQERYYINYFLLLINFWEYIPKENQINDLRIFIEKYYKDKQYLDIFNLAVRENIKANKKFFEYNNNNLQDRKKVLISLGTKWDINQ